MAQADYAALVAENPIMMALDEQQRQQVLQLARAEKYAAGAEIVSQGQLDDEVYLLCRGSVEVRVEERGLVVPVEQLGPGALFGEVARASGVPRTATVVANEEVEVLRFPGAAWLAIVRANEQAARLLHQMITRRAEDTLAETYGY